MFNVSAVLCEGPKMRKHLKTPCKLQGQPLEGERDQTHLGQCSSDLNIHFIVQRTQNMRPILLPNSQTYNLLLLTIGTSASQTLSCT